MDRIVVIDQGQISEIGSYDELLSHNGPFAQFLKTFLLKEESDESEDEDPESKWKKGPFIINYDLVGSAN